MRKLVVCIVAACLLGMVVTALSSSDVLFELQLANQHRLIIREVPSGAAGKVTLQVTYHNPPAIGTFMVAEQTVAKPNGPIAFATVADSDSGVVCVFDTNDVGFLLLYNRKTEDLWDSTRDSGGWHGSDRAEWQTLLNELRSRHPVIPYKRLPGSGQSTEPSQQPR